MDSITQIVLGASVGELVLGKKVGNKALFFGAIAGTIPDLDVIAKQFTDIVSANELHRGFSHSIIFCIIVAPVLGWMVHYFYRKKEEASWKDWTTLFFWCLVTHPLLDAHTTWGTQLFWPLDFKISYQNIFVVDPLYTLPFLVCTVATMFYKRTKPQRRYINKLGLILSSSYMLITLVLKCYTYYKFEKSLKNQHIDFNEISIRPTPLNTILWTANVDADSNYFIGYYSIFDRQDSIQYNVINKNRNQFDEIMNEDIVKRLIKLCKGWYIIQKTADGYAFNDLRFGMFSFDKKTDDFVFRYNLKYKKGILTVEQQEPEINNGREMMKALWERVKGN